MPRVYRPQDTKNSKVEVTHVFMRKYIKPIILS